MDPSSVILARDFSFCLILNWLFRIIVFIGDLRLVAASLRLQRRFFGLDVLQLLIGLGSASLRFEIEAATANDAIQKTGCAQQGRRLVEPLLAGGNALGVSLETSLVLQIAVVVHRVLVHVRNVNCAEQNASAHGTRSVRP